MEDGLRLQEGHPTVAFVGMQTRVSPFVRWVDSVCGTQLLWSKAKANGCETGPDGACSGRPSALTIAQCALADTQQRGGGFDLMFRRNNLKSQLHRLHVLEE